MFIGLSSQEDNVYNVPLNVSCHSFCNKPILALILCICRYSKSDWWVREKVREYLPAITLEDKGLVEYLKQAGIYEVIIGILVW